MAAIENVSYLFEIDQIRNATEAAAKELQKEIDRGRNSAGFFVILCVAIIKDSTEGTLNLLLIGLLASPIIGLIIDFFLRYLMKKYGWFEAKQAVQKKIKWTFYGLSFFVDNLPAVGTLPITTFTVFYIYRQIKDRAEEAKIELAELRYKAAEEIERIREEEAETEAEEIEIEKTEEAVQAGDSSYVYEEGGVGQSFPAPVERREKSNIIEIQGARKESGANRKGRKETMEEIFIPEEVRDPLGKLKKDFFETPPDKTNSESSDSKKPNNDTSFKEAA